MRGWTGAGRPLPRERGKEGWNEGWRKVSFSRKWLNVRCNVAQAGGPIKADRSGEEGSTRMRKRRRCKQEQAPRTNLSEAETSVIFPLVIPIGHRKVGEGKRGREGRNILFLPPISVSTSSSRPILPVATCRSVGRTPRPFLPSFLPSPPTAHPCTPPLRFSFDQVYLSLPRGRGGRPLVQSPSRRFNRR